MKKFLICDNDRDLLELLEIFLMSKGYDFMLVYEGSKVLETLKNNHIKLLLLDLNLSDMHGSEIIESIRNDEETMDVTIILLTASLRAKNDLDNMQVDGIIEKPFDLEELESVINA